LPRFPRPTESRSGDVHDERLPHRPRGPSSPGTLVQRLPRLSKMSRA
jgi:hypothetical protein